MILTDANVLMALLDRREPDHERCVAALSTLSGAMLTTWPVFTEAMHLLRAGGWPSQERLWRLVARTDLEVAEIGTAGATRARTLMEKYRDVPMDLGDASLVSLAEERGLRQIFTLDADFRVYRLHGRRPFEVIPAP